MDSVLFIAAALLWVYIKERERDALATPAPAEGAEQAVMGERCAEGTRYGHLILLDPPEKGWRLIKGDGDAA